MTAYSEGKQSLASFTDSAGLTWRHWVYFTLVTLILLADGMEITLISHTGTTRRGPGLESSPGGREHELLASHGEEVGGPIPFL